MTNATPPFNATRTRLHGCIQNGQREDEVKITPDLGRLATLRTVCLKVSAQAVVQAVSIVTAAWSAKTMQRRGSGSTGSAQSGLDPADRC
jgi:hypothetical protein